MNAQSMTGYGRGVSGNFKVEIRSSNHKNIDMSVNLPYYLFSCEPEIKKNIKKRFQRGRIEVFIPKQEVENIKLKVNKSLAREYYHAFESLKNELSLSDSIGIDMLASQRDIFLLDETEIDMKGLYDALDAALDELARSRKEEGEALLKDISERISLVHSYVDEIDRRRTAFTASAKDKLNERLKEFLGGMQMDETRLIQETAVLIERTDITEEVVRIRSHLRQFNDVIRSDDAIGKKLDFILQELRREINTIGSKANDFEISSHVVEVKHELEKIREQVQNLQ